MFPAAEESPGPVTFDHETHAALAESCLTCHATGWSVTVPGRPLAGALTYERIHEGDLCASCHDVMRRHMTNGLTLVAALAAATWGTAE